MTLQIIGYSRFSFSAPVEGIYIRHRVGATQQSEKIKSNAEQSINQSTNQLF